MLRNKSTMPKAYYVEDEALRVRRSKIGCLLIIVLTPGGLSLDKLLYPEQLSDFFLIRLVVVLANILILGLHYTSFGKRHVAGMSMLSFLSVVVYICLMIYLSDGALSPYYAVLNLMILGFSILQPWRYIETLLMSVAALLIYIGASYASHLFVAPQSSWNILFTNSYFILLSGIVAIVSSHLTTRARIMDFNLRTELDERNRELQEIDKMKTEFFANISHELRTPLTLILSPLQDLLHSPLKLDDKIASLLLTARDNSMRLLKLVNDILEVIKLEEGKANLSSVSIEVNAFLAGTINSMIHMAEPRGIEFKKELSEEPLVIQADTYAMERIFLNLFSNAIKFTPEGGSITVRSERHDDKVCVSVIDTGIGISKDEIPLIFDRFHQADGTSTRKYQGTGIGLALVKDLTDKMNGEISVISQPGAGTTMQVVFPLPPETYTEEEIKDMPVEGDILEVVHRSAEHRAALPTDTPYKDEEAMLPPGDGPILLVVDDEPDIRKYLVSSIEGDYRIVQARDGLQGLELARKYLPELMILDFMLPEMDGLEVCKVLKHDEKTKQIKIMLLTARMDEDTKITALDHGADDFLTKPFSKTEIQSRLRNLLQTATLERDLKQQNQELNETLAKLKDTQVQLVQSEKLNSLGTLAAGLMHEVNNPLNFTLTALQVAKRDPNIKNDEELKDLFSDIDEGMQRIRTIVSDLHTFAYPSEAEKLQPFLLSEAIESAMRFTAHQHNKNIITKNLSDMDEVIGSQSHIVQVLINLLNNALRAIEAVSNEREGEIIISSTILNERMVISVKDNGTGISEEIRSNIFDPFFTTQDVGEGMGLGLSICHTILENHDSSLIVNSEEGKWTEFSFSLALASAQTDIESYAAAN